MVALWLWATAEGVGSARQLERLCTEHLAYRWLCGGVAIDHQTLREFRLMHGDALDGLLARSLAALVEEGVINLELVSPDALKAQALTGASLARRGRRCRRWRPPPRRASRSCAQHSTETIPSPMSATPGRRAGAPRSNKACALMRRSRR